MRSRVTELANEVASRKEAEELVFLLLQTFTSETAYEKLLKEAVEIKQSPREVLKRRVSNLFSSFTTRRK